MNQSNHRKTIENRQKIFPKKPKLEALFEKNLNDTKEELKKINS